MRILIIEDEKSLAGLMEQTMRQHGYAAQVTHSLGEARKALTQPFDAIISDRRLPDGDGLELIKEIRASGNGIPVLMLTALGLPKDKVAGLEAGADDYLGKPFSLFELVARVKALLRRTAGAKGLQLEAGNVVLDTLHDTVKIDGKSALFGKREVVLLRHLLQRSGEVVGKDVLEQVLYGNTDKDDSGGDSRNALEVAVHRLRKLLEKHKATLEIVTVRGVGYMVDEAKTN